MGRPATVLGGFIGRSLLPCKPQNTMVVELNTPAGSVFSGHADGVELRTTDGMISIQPSEESYLNLTETTQIMLRVGAEFLTFALNNAAASLRNGCLTVVAEEARLMPATPASGAQ